MGTAVADAADVAGVNTARFRGPDPDLNRNAGCGKPRVTTARDLGIRILERRDDAGNASGDDRVGAGRGLAVMGARLERHVERRPARLAAGATERLDLRMRPAARLGPATPDDDRSRSIAAHHDGPHRRIGPRIAEASPPEGKGERHEAGIVGVGCRHRSSARDDGAYLCPRGANGHARYAPRYLRTGAAALSSSADSSPNTRSKSLASRKLR